MGTVKYLHNGKVVTVPLVNQSESPLKILDGGKVKGIPLGDTGPIKILVNGKVRCIGGTTYKINMFWRDRASVDNIIIHLQQYIREVFIKDFFACYNLTTKTWGTLYEIPDMTFGTGGPTTSGTIPFHCDYLIKPLPYSVDRYKFRKINWKTSATIGEFNTYRINSSISPFNLNSLLFWSIEGNISRILITDLSFIVILDTTLKKADDSPKKIHTALLNDNNIYAESTDDNKIDKYDLSGNYLINVLTSLVNAQYISNTRIIWDSSAMFENTKYIYDLSYNLIFSLPAGAGGNRGRRVGLFDDKIICSPTDTTTTHINIYDINGGLTECREIIDGNGQLKDG